MDLKGRILSLSERERILLSLYFIEGLSYDEIGYVMNENKEKIEREINKLINNLRKVVNKERSYSRVR
jgi:RNA polymerase sigma factor (sigma-70 family)